ncbi:MAG TPA: class I SAM-dependent methyltransferase [Pyrinomonadaceae bacterium]|jgi:SAM-dependent methyltransferase
MNPYTAETYGESVADFYDGWYADHDAAMIDVLAELAGAGRALELGIGTGRIALPLAARGVEVHGLDASPAMIEKLRAKPGGARLPVTVGDFADVSVAGEFALVYVVFNTFFALLTQEAQVRCFRQVAARLAPGGAFVIEAFVPDLTRYDRYGTTNKPVRVTTERVELDIATHDAARQRIVAQKVVLTDGQVRLFPIEIRYAWPSELDLMAQLAGLTLRQRWAGWRREQFDAHSGKHVSVYGRGEVS